LRRVSGKSEIKPFTPLTIALDWRWPDKGSDTYTKSYHVIELQDACLRIDMQSVSATARLCAFAIGFTVHRSFQAVHFHNRGAVISVKLCSFVRTCSLLVTRYQHGERKRRGLGEQNWEIPAERNVGPKQSRVLAHHSFGRELYKNSTTSCSQALPICRC
jgi:hypothetical protein